MAEEGEKGPLDDRHLVALSHLGYARNILGIVDEQQSKIGRQAVTEAR